MVKFYGVHFFFIVLSGRFVKMLMFALVLKKNCLPLIQILASPKN